jgi:hypothetical protein
LVIDLVLVILANRAFPVRTLLNKDLAPSHNRHCTKAPLHKCMSMAL